MMKPEDLKPPIRSTYDRETGAISQFPYRWVPMKGKTLDQVFNDIVEELPDRHLTFNNVSDLLNQAHALVWRLMPNPEKTSLYKYIKEHESMLDWYHTAKSKRRKAEILKEVRNEIALTLENYLRNE